jgi:cytochrome P450
MKLVPDGGQTIHGMFIPGGTAIGMNMSSLLWSKELFGEDAHLFRPERFLEASDAQREEMKRNVELVFGYGRWMCAGKPIAMMELNKVIFEVRFS